MYERDIDFKRFVVALRKADYANDLCVENECLGKFPPEQHAAVFAKEIAYLKEILEQRADANSVR